MNLTVSEVATERLLSILNERGSEGQGVRLSTQASGCGCGASSFGLAIDGPSDEDAVFELGGVRFILDPASAEKLDGAAIDYVEDVMRQGFSIEAPNVGGGACGCGGH